MLDGKAERKWQDIRQQGARRHDIGQQGGRTYDVGQQDIGRRTHDTARRTHDVGRRTNVGRTDERRTKIRRKSDEDQSSQRQWQRWHSQHYNTNNGLPALA
jgi:hypothetical protein